MDNKGITLIALVITIIVLAILAGISIRSFSGNDGIIDSAIKAKDITEISSEKEIIEKSVVEAIGKSKYGYLEYDKFKKILDDNSNNGVTIEEVNMNFNVTFIKSQRMYKVTQDGEVTEKELIKEAPGLYYAGTDELIMTWEELITPSNQMLIDNNGTLNRSNFNLSAVQDKKGSTVGSSAFVKLVVDTSITSLGTINGITQLEEIKLPNSITTLSSFAGCVNLKTINIPDSVAVIPSNLFPDECDLVNLTIGDGVTEIPNSFLSGGRTQRLINLKLGKNIERIGDNAFDAGFTKIKEIILPKKIKIIGTRAFADCTSLERITFPEGLESIGINAFDECINLKSITLPSSLRELKSNVFYGCTGLEEVTILNGLATIPEKAFNGGCSNLKTIRIPKSITTIERYAFSGCTRLTDVYYEGSNAQWNNISIDLDNTELQSATLHVNS